MDTMSAFARGEASRGQEPKVFDWVTAAKLIQEHNASEASAGLAEDWEYTGGSIWSHGAPVPSDSTYTFLSSTWATPELIIDGEFIDCWIWESESPGWSAKTYWPAEALAVLVKA